MTFVRDGKCVQMRTRSGASYKEIIKRDKKREKRAAQIGIKPEPKIYLSVRSIRKVRQSNTLDRTLNVAAQYQLPDSDSDSDTRMSSDSDSSTNTLIEIPITNRTSNKTQKMSDHLTKVSKLKFEGNLSENWKRFKRNFDIFLVAGELTQKNDKIKVSLLLNAIGEEGVRHFDSFEITEANREIYAEVVKAFDNFCSPKKNTVYERYVFRQRTQSDGEPFDTFLIHIRQLVSTCEFGDKENEMLRDQIVMGVNDHKLQRKLLETADLTYNTAVDKCRAHEVTAEQMTAMSKTVSVNQIEESNHVASKKNTHYRKQHKGNNNKRHNTQSSNSSNSSKGNRCESTNERRGQQQQTYNTHRNGNTSNAEKIITNCKYCSLTHKVRQCPAYGKTCNSCSRKNHFSSVCKSKNVSALSAYDSNCDEFSDNEEYFISSIEKVYAIVGDDDDVRYPWVEKIWIGGKLVAFKIDTGAQVNVIPLNVFLQMRTGIELHRTNVKLRAFSGEKLKPIGMCSLLGKFGKNSCDMKTAVVDIDIMPILGLKSCIELGFVSPTVESRTFTNTVYQNKNL